VDPYLHTIIATGCIAAAFYFGRKQGVLIGAQAAIMGLAAGGVIKLIYDSDGDVDEILPMDDNKK